ncbi:MAG: response regulator transcription factor [Syntrophomonadaceae bacterium]|nr:response regulator transcription factor [Syntrophomonadaceae bacterium]
MVVKQHTILVADDEPRLVRLVKANLEVDNYRVLVAYDGASALKIVEMEQPDLVILDIMLPDMDGYEVCQRIREFSAVPVIMLTARAREKDRIQGFDAGADDYLTKPFSTQELLARVKAVLRRSTSRQEQPVAVYRSQGLVVDFVQRRVFVGEREVFLTPTEYTLLYHLAQNAGKVMLHGELLSRVWGPEYRDELQYLRGYISNLRKKLEDDPSHPRYILSRPGIGYYMIDEE